MARSRKNEKTARKARRQAGARWNRAGACQGADAAGAHFCEPPGVKEGIINERIYDRTE